MIRVRGALVVMAMSVLLLGGLIVPAVAEESDELCGPYTDETCPEPEDEGGEVAVPGDDDTEVGGEIVTETMVDDDGPAASDESRVLGTTLARTGIEAWMLSLLGLFLVGGGIAVLAARRHGATID